MDFLSNLSLGFSVAFSIANLGYCFVGALLGTFIGVLPGVGPLVTIAVLLPLTFGLPIDGAMIMLAGIYYGAQYGGSTTAILINMPGESSSAVTCIDGYQMARQGRAGPALAIAAIGSLVAGCIGTLLIAVLAPLLGSIALSFGPAEYASLMIFSLCATATLAKGSMVRSLGMIFLGILFGLVGTDIKSGVVRFAFGNSELLEGVQFVAVTIGIFAFVEIVASIVAPSDREILANKVSNLMPTLKDLKETWKPMLRGTAVGSFFGPLPGAGATISSFAAYIMEKNLSRKPEKFGFGAIEGVAAPEAANNAAAQTSFIPTLTLGIPGTATMALMIGALTIQGITPGPTIMETHAPLFWGLVVSMWIGNVILVILNLPLIGLWVKMLKMPYNWLFPGILVFSCIGLYTVDFSTFDIVQAAAFALLGFVFKKLGCEPAPFILGFILGPMLEDHFRRAMSLSRGDPTIFVREPLSLFFLVLAALFVALLVIPSVRRRKDKVVTEEE